VLNFFRTEIGLQMWKRFIALKKGDLKIGLMLKMTEKEKDFFFESKVPECISQARTP
jgi:hypothetical protein